MSNSLFQDIRGALTTQANATSGMPTTRSYEGVPISPTTGVPYVAYALIPTQERPASLGPAGMTLRQGLFQISLHYPDGSGSGAVEAMADAVKGQFIAGNVLTQGQASVRIRYAERAQALQQPDWISVPVTVGWDLHTPTTP